MKFLVDSQLPVRLCTWLREHDHDARHVSELANGNRSTDNEVVAIADAENLVLVSKDADFRHSHLLQHQPRQLLAIVTGNTSNKALINIFEANLDLIVAALNETSFVELGSEQLVVHNQRPAPEIGRGTASP